LLLDVVIKLMWWIRGNDI